ncbi:MAG TPA: hypothetical protein VJ385_22120 [Fibrobacteria bacterium]|nr:hypothetical protein [Fibrobacteria bacterium]
MTRESLWKRLPGIYAIRDSEQVPPGRFQAYMGLLDRLFAEVHADIGRLHDDLFIERCREWAIPYLGDLLGVSALKGDAWTMRADVARTIRHRRRKGTLGAIESIAFTLTGWAAHAAEAWPRLAWTQHLNHQRPDAGGRPPLAHARPLSAPVRGGTVNLRDPAQLSLLGGAFDPFSHLLDVNPGGEHNLPVLLVFLWRLRVFVPPFARPVPRGMSDLGGDFRALRFDLDPLGRPFRLCNTHRFLAHADPPELSGPDRAPAPMAWARLDSDSHAGRPSEYIRCAPYAVSGGFAAGGPGLTLHMPSPALDGLPWRFRGANLCAWEAGLNPPLRDNEVVVDPDRGRLLIGVEGEATRAVPLRDGLFVSAGYGFPGPTGAHPVARPAAPPAWDGVPADRITVNGHDPLAPTLAEALGNLSARTIPLIIEISDSLVHDLDPAAVPGIGSEGGPVLRLGGPLWIRAASGHRPVIRLAGSLRFRPHDVLGPQAPARMAAAVVRLEGLFLARDAGFADAALIERIALNRLELDGCTLDPEGHTLLDGKRAPLRPALRGDNQYGFADAAEEIAFDQTPRVEMKRCVCGAIALDDGYALSLSDTVVDAGAGPGDPDPALAILAASGPPETAWGPDVEIDGLTVFGRIRVTMITGQGGIFAARVLVHDDQKGCLRFSHLGAKANRLPPNHGCAFAPAARAFFTSIRFGEPGYARLDGRSGRPLREDGPLGDEMGAFGYLRNTAKLKNLSIRLREYLPAGMRTVIREET